MIATFTVTVTVYVTVSVSVAVAETATATVAMTETVTSRDVPALHAPREHATAARIDREKEALRAEMDKAGAQVGRADRGGGGWIST